MNRRRLLGALGAGALDTLGSRALADTAALTPEAVCDAWLAGLPLIEMAAARRRMFDPSTPGQKAGVNAFRHTRDLVTAVDHSVTTPNNDTLFSSAWIDLSAGPVQLTVPQTGGRYQSVAIMDMYTNNNVILGARTPGGAAGDYTLVGPGYTEPRGPRVLQIATPHAWMLGRTLVDGPRDIEAARKVQSGLVATGPHLGPYPAAAVRADGPQAYFASVRELLASDPPRTRAGMAALPRIAAADPGVLAEGVAQGREALKSARGRLRFQDGWQYPLPDLGDFGDDFRYRALIAVAGLGALTPHEAMYMRAAGDTGKGLFEGDGPFRLSLTKPLPVNAFWSLTMYQATLDGQFFLAENPIARYSIGDRTPGLRMGRDGAVDLWIGRRDPGGERTANWLPAPARGPWAITLRAYLPKAELLSGAYRLPPLATG